MSGAPIVEGILSGSLDDPVLLGGACPACGVVTFPAQRSCPRCASEAMGVMPLPRRGTLWTWTVQRFPPKSPPYHRAETPESFEPYAVGYVDLAGAVRVEARLVGAPPEDLHIGMEMELTVIPLRTAPDSTEVLIPAFRPVPAHR